MTAVLPPANALPALIREAARKRSSFAEKHPAFRLFNGIHDGWEGLEIEIYGKVALIRTRDAATDKKLEKIADVLGELFPLETILLKNHFPERAAAKLELSQGVLRGPASASPLAVTENGRAYGYDPEDKDFFPLADRPLRDWFFRAKKLDNILSLGIAGENLLPLDSDARNFSRIPTAGKSLTDVTIALRQLEIPGTGFDFIAADASFVGNVAKNRKALYHLWHHVFRKMAAECHFALKTPHLKETLFLWKNLAAKTGWRAEVLNETGPAEDFPRLLNAAPAPKISYARLRFTRWAK